MTRLSRTIAVKGAVVASTPRDATGGSTIGGGGGFTSSSFSISFHDISTNSPTSWAWTFYAVNGSVLSTSTQQNPLYTFPASGVYRVTLLTSVSSTLADHLVTVV